MQITLASIQKLHDAREKIAMLTCYDASFAALLDEAGVEVLLVGDSLGMVFQGHGTTLPVTLEDMAYHVACVARGAKRAFIIGDLPFATYQESPQQAFASSARLMAAGAHMVKLEGGEAMVPQVEFLTGRGVPVCAHLGLTPQSVHALGGYRVQGKTEEGAARLKREALALQNAGAAMLVLEAIPASLAKDVTASLSIPTVGIGAGPDCSGQVLVLYDMLDVYPGRKGKFTKNFMAGADSIQSAAKAYVREVKSGAFPGPEHCF